MNIVKNDNFMKRIIDNMDTLVRVVNEDHKIVYMNKRMKNVFGDLEDCPCMSIMDRALPCENCVSCKALKKKKDQEKTEVVKNRIYKVMASPVIIDSKHKYAIEIFQDITEQNEMERKLLEHYDKLRESVEYAKRVQTGMLPKDKCYWNMIDLKSCYMPCEALGGDIFDIVQLTDDICLFYIADVAGHGVKASLMTMFIRQTMRTFEGFNPSMEEVIRYIEKQLQDTNPQKEEYITILIGKYDKMKREVRLINGGHNCPALFIEPEGDMHEKTLSGLPIATLFSNLEHSILDVDVKRNTKMLLYTDGIIEADNGKGKEFGVEGIKKAIDKYSPKEEKSLPMHIYEAGEKYANGKLNDDVTIVEITFI